MGFVNVRIGYFLLFVIVDEASLVVFLDYWLDKMNDLCTHSATPVAGFGRPSAKSNVLTFSCISNASDLFS